MNNIYYFSDKCVKLENGDRIILTNNLNGESIKLSKECYEILLIAVENKKTPNEIIDSLQDNRDKEYFRKLFKLLLEREIMVNMERENEVKLINIDITHRCNLQCKHCSMSASTLDEEEKINTEEWLKIIEKVINLNPHSISISGGEPLVRKDIWEILDYIKRIYSGELILMTNSLLINESNVDKLISIFDRFDISIDGVDEKTCSVIRGTGVFNKIIQSVNILKQHGAEKISLSMVDVKPTHDHIDDFKKLNNELGTFPMIREFNNEGRGYDNNSILLVEEEEDYDKLMELAKEIGKKECKRGQAFSCGAGRNQLHINSQGKLYPCAPLEYDEFILGDLLEIDDLNEFFNKKITSMVGYKNMIKLMPNKNEHCRNCNVSMFCWSCIHDIYLNTRYNKNFKKKCKLKKTELMSIWR